MTHVRIKWAKNPVDHIVEVDGFNLTPHLMAYGFGITFPEAVEGPVVVHMQIVADELELDLPHSLIEALRVDAEGEPA